MLAIGRAGAGDPSSAIASGRPALLCSCGELLPASWLEDAHTALTRIASGEESSLGSECLLWFASGISPRVRGLWGDCLSCAVVERERPASDNSTGSGALATGARSDDSMSIMRRAIRVNGFQHLTRMRSVTNGSDAPSLVYVAAHGISGPWHAPEHTATAQHECR